MLNHLQAKTKLGGFACVVLGACAGPPVADRAALDQQVRDIQAQSSQKLGYKHWARLGDSSRPQASTGERLNLRLSGVPANQVLEALSQTQGLGYETDECGLRPISIRGQGLSLGEVLGSMARQTGAVIQQTGLHVQLSCEQEEYRRYTLDYLDLQRKLTDLSSLSSVLERRNSNGLQSGTGSGSTGNADFGNQSRLTLNTTQTHELWDALTQHLEFLLAEGESPYSVRRQERTNEESENKDYQARNEGRRSRLSSPESQSKRSLARNEREVTLREDFRFSGRVVVHPESATVTVRAKPEQHRRIADWLAGVQRRLSRQVLVEAVIAEVKLSKRFERGIDWNLLRTEGLTAGLNIRGLPANNPALSLTVNDSGSKGEISTALTLLDLFGQTKVVSSPRLLTMNQQPAVLKVIDNRVYFTTEVQTSAPTNNSPAFSTFNTQVQTVPVGFLMTVSAQISDQDHIQLRVRPTLSRIVGFVQDPNPALRQLNIVSQIPEIQTREMESLLRIKSGELILLGGLKQQSGDSARQGLPDVPADYAWLAGSEMEASQTTELVILLKASVQGEDSELPLNTVEQQAGKPMAANGAQRLNAQLRQALDWAQGGEAKAAHHLMNALIAQHPHQAELPFNLALLQANQQQIAQARQSLEQAQSLCQSNASCTLPILELQAWLEAR